MMNGLTAETAERGPDKLLVPSIPVNSSRLFFFFFADLRPFKPPALAVLVYFFFQCVICINKVS